MKTSVLFYASLLCIGNCFSQNPAITGFTGAITHGATITLSGSNFGTKSSAPPIAFEDMESGTFLPYWSNKPGLSITTNKQRSALSSYSAYHNFKNGTSNDIHNAYFTGSNSILSPVWYASYWVYLDPNFNWQDGAYPHPSKFLSNVKIFRLWNPQSVSENFVMATAGWENNAIYYASGTGDPAHYGFHDYPNKYLSTGKWHHLQFAYAENSGLGVADGKFYVWDDGELVISSTNHITRGTQNLLKRPYIIGFYNSWSPAEGTPDTSDVAPNEYYMDDVYIDTTWARVEIGDKQHYLNCKHRELQRPQTWTATSINFKLNRGSFTTSDTLYAFVVDSKNRPSIGYRIYPSAMATHTNDETVIVENSCQNHPNPFSTSTTISFQLQTLSSVSLKIYDYLGREVTTLLDDVKIEGKYSVEWDGSDSAGKQLNSGIYYYQLSAGKGASVTKSLIIKR